MSTEDLQNLTNILQGVLNPDNNLRKEAELKLNQIRENKPAFCFCLTKLLVESPEKSVKTLASVLLRKTLSIGDKEEVSAAWLVMDANTKTSIKENILKAVIAEADKNQKIKYCDTMATVAENVFESKDTWPDLFNYIYEGISLELNPTNIPNIETVLFLLTQIFGLVYEEMITKLEAFITTFQNFFKSDDFNLKSRTSQVIAEILSIVKKKDSKKFKEFVPLILEHTMKCLTTDKQEHNLKICIMALSDLANSEPNILRKWFGDLFILLGKISEKKDLDEQSLRDLGFEIIVTLVESQPKLFTTDKDRMNVFI